jgi:hypothetical protein
LAGDILLQIGQVDFSPDGAGGGLGLFRAEVFVVVEIGRRLLEYGALEKHKTLYIPTLYRRCLRVQVDREVEKVGCDGGGSEHGLQYVQAFENYDIRWLIDWNRPGRISYASCE